MKSLQELKAGDCVGLWYKPLGHPRSMTDVWRVERVTDASIFAFGARFKRESGYERRAFDGTSKDEIRPISEEEFRAFLDKRSAELDEYDKRQAKQKALEETEAWQLASKVTAWSDTNQLSTMPVDRLRQIVAWLGELTNQERSKP